MLNVANFGKQFYTTQYGQRKALNTVCCTYDKKSIVKEAILKRHRHQYEGSHEKNHSESDTKGEKGFFNSTASNLSKLPGVKSLANLTSKGKLKL